MDPLVGAALIGAGGNAITSAAGGGGQAGNASIVSRAQRRLLYDLQMRALQGQLGDMGGGTAYRQGQANLQQFMADRGVSPDSGAYTAGLANVAAQAQQQDTNNLRQYILGLAGTPVQTVQGIKGWTKPDAALSGGYGQSKGPDLANATSEFRRKWQG